MTVLKCKHCLNIFFNISSLHHHQKTAKYCLKLQGVKVEKYKCDYCDKKLSTQQNLNNHLVVCIKYITHTKVISLKNKIKKYKSTISKLEKNNKELQNSIYNITISAHLINPKI